MILLRAEKERSDEALVAGITSISFMIMTVHTDENATLEAEERSPRMRTTLWIVMISLLPSVSHRGCKEAVEPVVEPLTGHFCRTRRQSQV